MDVLVNISLVQGKDDSFAWKHDVCNGFFVKSFSLQVQNVIFGTDQTNSNIVKVWKDIAPPRVEILVWFVHLQRLNTRDRLCKWKILNPIQAICPFCCMEVETMNHLFFSCVKSWKLWSACLLWWNFNGCFPNEAEAVFDYWSGFPIFGNEKKLWISLYYAGIATIWKLRNQVILKDINPDWKLEITMMKLNVGYWISGRCFEDKLQTQSILNDLNSFRFWLRHIRK